MNPRVSPRHPAARARGADLARTASLLARRVGPEPGDGPHRMVALALQAVRGRQRRSVAAFALAYGLDEDLVRRIEAGWVGPADVPVVLRILTAIDPVQRAIDAPAPCYPWISASASRRAQR